MAPSGAQRGAPPRTPDHLAEKIIQSRAALEGERRTVTVLFADAKGFTPLSERLDEEHVYDLIQGCTARMVESVQHFEGTVTQFRGDGVLALFGAPIAREDSARRAVAAALEMQRCLNEYGAEIAAIHSGVECRFRVGLNTGPVVVGRISDDLDMDYTAIGDTVNLAARMEELAELGMVYMSESTYQAVRDYIECEPLGQRAVKGKERPVSIYRAVRELPVRSRFDVAVERGLTPFVGRAQELTVLRSHLAQAKRGQGQVVLLSGEAGIGKSRLLLEFRRSVETDGPRWLEGQCSPLGKNSPYLPFVDVVKRAFNVEETDDEEDIIARVEDGADHWDEAARTAVPFLKFLLSVDPGDSAVADADPLGRRRAIVDSLRTLLQQMCRTEPLVLAIEDLHWADDQSSEALRGLVEVVTSHPVLFVITSRPGYGPTSDDLGQYSRLALASLGDEDSATLAGYALRGVSLPQEVRDLIVDKAEGNPLFVEEVTKHLLDSGAIRRTNGSYSLERPAEEIEVPATLHEVILSRIDMMEPSAREAIQLASVIGREFTVRLLERISMGMEGLDASLARLRSLELVYEKAHFPELSYMFKHAVTHEVAYSTLLLERRRELHLLVAQAIEELYSDRLAEHYEALAHHYDEARDRDKALDYLLLAGDKATAAFANDEAIRHLRRGLELLDGLPDPEDQRKRRLDFLIALMSPLIHTDLWAGTTYGATAHNALDLAREVGDPRQLVRALAAVSVFEILHGNIATSFGLVHECLILAHGEENTDLMIEGLNLLGHQYFRQGDQSAAREHLERCVALCEKYGYNPPTHLYGLDMFIATVAYLARVLWLLGYPDASAATEQRVLSMARDQLHPLTHALAVDFMADLHQYRREPDEVYPLALETAAVSQEYRFDHLAGDSDALLGWVRARRGETNEGIAQMIQGLADRDATGTVLGRPHYMGALADAYLMAGRPNEGLACIEDALQRVEATGEAMWEAELHRLRGDLLRMWGGHQESAEAAYRQAIEVARRQEVRSLELRATVSLARLLCGDGRGEEAQELLAAIYDWFTEGFDTQDLKEAKAVLEELG